MPAKKRLNPTATERLFAHRRRLGLTQQQMAERLGVKVTDYIDQERGEAELTGSVRKCATKLRAKLEPNEICTLLRRRNGVTIRAVAQDIGRSRWWVNQMELGTAPIRELADHWGI